MSDHKLRGAIAELRGLVHQQLQILATDARSHGELDRAEKLENFADDATKVSKDQLLDLSDA